MYYKKSKNIDGRSLTQTKSCKSKWENQSDTPKINRPKESRKS